MNAEEITACHISLRANGCLLGHSEHVLTNTVNMSATGSRLWDSSTLFKLFALLCRLNVADVLRYDSSAL